MENGTNTGKFPNCNSCILSSGDTEINFALLFWSIDLFFFCLPCLSSIHEKANYIAMFSTVSPHSLGSCYFRVTCLPHCNGELKCCALNACKHGPLWVCVCAPTCSSLL